MTDYRTVAQMAAGGFSYWLLHVATGTEFYAVSLDDIGAMLRRCGIHADSAIATGRYRLLRLNDAV